MKKWQPDVPGRPLRAAGGLFATFADPDGNAVTIYQDTSPNPAPDQKALLG